MRVHVNSRVTIRVALLGSAAMMPGWLAGARDGNGTEVLANAPLPLMMGSRLLALRRAGRMQRTGTAMVNTTGPCGAPADRVRGLGEGSISSTL